jgi:putative PIN family toxin of toxin-antitoxin system
VQKLIIDTNVWVAAMIQKSYPFWIKKLYQDGLVDLCISAPVLDEYRDVFSRPKFGKYPGFYTQAEALLAFIDADAEKFIPTQHFDLLPDKDDNMFLDLAWASSADFLITGNTNDFILAQHGKTKILTPVEYWNEHRPIY